MEENIIISVVIVLFISISISISLGIYFITLSTTIPVTTTSPSTTLPVTTTLPSTTLPVTTTSPSTTIPVTTTIPIVDKCSIYTDESTNISDTCLEQLWKDSKCITPIEFSGELSSRGATEWRKMTLNKVKTDMYTWANNQDDTAKKGCYNITPPPPKETLAPINTETIAFNPMKSPILIADIPNIPPKKTLPPINTETIAFNPMRRSILITDIPINRL
jgi:hypothetical protein